MAGQTAGSAGKAGEGNGNETEDAAKARRAQGYGGDKDMDTTIGA